MDGARALRALPDDELLLRLAELLRRSRRVDVDLIAHIGEVDHRRLYAREASPSMFAYCTDVLHLSEHEAYLRITAARAARRHPELLAMLRDGRLHLSGLAKLLPHLTAANRDDLLARAAHKSKRQIEELIARLAPRPDAPARMRKMPQPVPRATQGGGGESPAAPRPVGRSGAGAPQLGPDRVGGRGPEEVISVRAAPAAQPRRVVEPLAPARYKVQFTASAELRDKLERLQSLMRSSVPDGDLATIIEAAVAEKLERLEAKRFAKAKAPRKDVAATDTSGKKRYIPAPVRRAVHDRDGGQCRYVDEKGRRCRENTQLEFHHHRPYGRGGDHRPENLRLMCRAHNAYLAEREYGTAAVDRYRTSSTVARPGAAGPSG